MVRDEFPHSLKVKATLNHADGPVYPPVTCNDGVVVRRNDFLDAVFRDDDFVVRPQLPVLEVFTLLICELQGCGVEEVGKTSGS